MNPIRFDCSVAAAAHIINLVDLNSPKAELMGKLTQIVLCAIDRAIDLEREEAGRPRFLCLGCYRRLRVRSGSEGRKVRCPQCKTVSTVPERSSRN